MGNDRLGDYWHHFYPSFFLFASLGQSVIYNCGVNLGTSLQTIPGIGPTFGQRLAKLELERVEDLIYHFPFRYDDFSKISKVSQLTTEEIVTLRGQIWSIQNTYTKFRKVLTKAILNDGTGSVEITWFNQPWITKSLAVSDHIQISGKIERFKDKISLTAPEWEKVPGGDPNFVGKHTGRLVPIYPETYGLTSKWLRNKITEILPRVVDQVEDPLPEEIREGMFPLWEALEQIHYPDSLDKMQQAAHRLAFDELFFIQLATQKKRLEWKSKPTTTPWKIDSLKLDNFMEKLPFALTRAQKRVVGEIQEDLKGTSPMNRLVQGDVGSGKTIIATIIAYLGHLNNYQTLLMAPTEILAFQHYKTLSTLLEPHGITVGIYTGSRKETVANAKEAPNVVVGTHALLSEKLNLDRVGLVIIDEQQRFGVEQRSILRSKGTTPHFLTMTATPIPRTVALTLYGDLEVSVIDEMPKGRLQIKTHFVPREKRDDAYGFIAKEVADGHQVYIVTPLIEESETSESAKAAKVEYERLSRQVFPQLKLGLLHGRLKSKEKEAVINAFKNHEIDILVSTSVVEVGVDVPNATIMMIEGSERFGLAQLHQLRGRVGRGEAQSYCLLFATEDEPQAVSRLKNLETIYDGLKLAELDLKMRGSGDIFGTRQSGRWDLKIASLSDLGLVEKTRAAALKILHQDRNLDQYPQLKVKLANLEKVNPD